MPRKAKPTKHSAKDLKKKAGRQGLGEELGVQSSAAGFVPPMLQARSP